METDLIDDAACAASDLTARLLAELSQARAQQALHDARALAACSKGIAIPAELRNESLLLEQKVAVLHQLLDGMPAIESDGGEEDETPEGGDCRASA
ncbi:MAG: hypothetical protein AB8H80_13545 [Planctomycetota bacterium]